jgi:hypothetical protein
MNRVILLIALALLLFAAKASRRGRTVEGGEK